MRVTVLLLALLLGAVTLTLAEDKQNTANASEESLTENASSKIEANLPRAKREEPPNKEQEQKKKNEGQKKPVVHHPKRPAPKPHWPKPRPQDKWHKNNKPPNNKPAPPKPAPKQPAAKKPAAKKPANKQPHPHNKPHPVKRPHPHPVKPHPHPVKKAHPHPVKPHPHPAKKPSIVKKPIPQKKPHPVKKPQWVPAHPKSNQHLRQHVRQHSPKVPPTHPQPSHPPHVTHPPQSPHPRPVQNKAQPVKKTFHGPHRWYKPPVQRKHKGAGPVRSHTPLPYPIAFPIPHHPPRNIRPSEKREQKWPKTDKPTNHHKTYNRYEDISNDRSNSYREESSGKTVVKKQPKSEQDYFEKDEETYTDTPYEREREGSRTKTATPPPSHRQAPRKKQRTVQRKKPAPRSERQHEIKRGPDSKQHVHKTTQLIRELMEPLRHHTHKSGEGPPKKADPLREEPTTPPCDCDKAPPTKERPSKETPKRNQPCDEKREESKNRKFDEERSRENEEFYDQSREESRERSDGQENYLYDYMA